MRCSPVLALVAGACLFSPLQAVEVGVLLDKQIGTTQGFGVGYLGRENQAEAANPKGFGIRVASTIIQVWKADLGIVGTYHPQAQANFIEDLSPNPPQHFGSFKVEYAALGAQLDWNRPVNLHLGGEVRREHLNNSGLGYSTDLTRPWFSAGLGYSFPLPGIKPIVRLEGAYALSHKSLGATWDQTDLLRAMASRYQISLYLGVRL